MTHQYKKTKLAAAILAASVAAPESAVSWSAGDWEVSYSGFINSFANYANDGAQGGDDNFHLSEGLLPAFHNPLHLIHSQLNRHFPLQIDS